MNTRPSWQPLDVTDSLFAYPVHRVITGLRVPEPDVVRQRVRDLVTEVPVLARAIDDVEPRWRPLGREELRDLPERAVSTTHFDGAPEEAVDHLRGQTLDRTPFRLVLGPGWVGYSKAHSVLDGWSSLALLGAILGGRSASSWQSVSASRRDRLLAGYLAGHAEPWRAAWRYRATTTGPRSEGPAVAGAGPVLTHVRSSDAFMPDLRAIRNERWPTASLGALVLVGLRGAMADAGMQPGPGQEVLYDLRRYFPGQPGLFGNWSAGLQVVAGDPRSPESTGRAMRDAAESGLPVAAMAAHRLLTRRPRRPGGPVLLAEPHGRPRLTYSWFGPHSGSRDLPWSDGERDVLIATSPSSLEAVTTVAYELAGRLSLNVSHFAERFTQDAVRGALTQLVEDPASCFGPHLVPEGRS